MSDLRITVKNLGPIDRQLMEACDNSLERYINQQRLRNSIADEYPDIDLFAENIQQDERRIL